MHFVTCPKQGREMEAVVRHRVGFLAYPCPKQGQDFKPSAAPLYPNMGQVPPPPPRFRAPIPQRSGSTVSNDAKCSPISASLATINNCDSTSLKGKNQGEGGGGVTIPQKKFLQRKIAKKKKSCRALISHRKKKIHLLKNFNPPPLPLP